MKLCFDVCSIRRLPSVSLANRVDFAQLMPVFVYNPCTAPPSMGKMQLNKTGLMPKSRTSVQSFVF